jgi:hypothetical protein
MAFHTGRSAVEQGLIAEQYNYDRFTPSQVVDEIRRTIGAAGLRAGTEAPDFELEQVEGAPVRLSRLRGRPVLMRFVSPS